jgi:hypothetical protein
MRGGVRWLFLGVLCVHLALSHSHNYLVGPDDDRLWLYATGAELGRADASRTLSEAVVASMRAAGASDYRLFRFELRAAYHRNYLLPSIAYRGGQELARRATDDWASRYTAYMARAMYAGYLVAYAAACAGLLLVVARLGEPRLLAAATAAVSGIAVLEVAFDLAGEPLNGLPTLVPLPDAEAPLSGVFWPTALGLVLNPQVQLSPFGDNPRNHVILLATAVFLLRWTGRVTASYGLVLVLCFLHQSMAGLLFAFLAAVDLVVRPAMFHTRTGLVMAAVAVTFASRETLGAFVGWSRPPALAAAAAALALFGAVLYGSLVPASAPGRAWSRITRWVPRGTAAADVAVIGALWLATLPIVALITHLASYNDNVYFWTQVHGRALGLLRPALVLALVMALLDRLARRVGDARALAIVLAACAASTVPSLGAALAHDRRPIDRIERGIARLERRAGPGIDWPAIGRSSEEEIYFALSRALELGTAPPRTLEPGK